IEVFGTPPPPPPRHELPAPLAATLADGRPRVEHGREWRPIANEKACHACHPAAPALRGVLALTPLAEPAPAREDVIPSLVESAFVQIMTAEQESELDN